MKKILLIVILALIANAQIAKAEGPHRGNSYNVGHERYNENRSHDFNRENYHDFDRGRYESHYYAPRPVYVYHSVYVHPEPYGHRRCHDHECCW